MSRILVVGSAGAGKSSLASRLGGLLGLPVIHLDCLFWQPGWVQREAEAFAALQEELVAGERWIIDGNYSGTLDIRLSRADTVIWLDYPRTLCLYRAVRRYCTHRNKTREDMAPGCPEKLDWEFLNWIWNYPKRNRGRMLERLPHLRASKQVLHFKHPREAEAFLNTLAQRAVPNGMS